MDALPRSFGFTLRARPAVGMVLVVVLLFIMAISSIAIFAARSVTMGEQMSNNELQHQIARQAAEAALRDAERDLTQQDSNLPAGASCKRSGGFRSTDKNTYEFNATCQQGECSMPPSRYNVAWSDATSSNPGEPWWPISKGGVWNDGFLSTAPNTGAPANCIFTGGIPLGLYTAAPRLIGVARQPEYLIELLSPGQDAGLENKDYRCDTAFNGSSGFSAAGLTTKDANQSTPKCHLFRITARGWGPSTATEVVMQSYFSILIN